MWRNVLTKLRSLYYFRHTSYCTHTHTQGAREKNNKKKKKWKNSSVHCFGLLTRVDNLTFAIYQRDYWSEPPISCCLHRITLSLLFAACEGNTGSTSTLVELFTWTERSAHDTTLLELCALPQQQKQQRSTRENEPRSARERRRENSCGSALEINDWTCRRCQPERMSIAIKRERERERWGTLSAERLCTIWISFGSGRKLIN